MRCDVQGGMVSSISVRYQRIDGQFRLLTIVLLAVGVGVFGFIPGMGIPGFLAYGLPDAVFSVLFGPLGYRSIFEYPSMQGDAAAWPLAILCTWLLPPGLVLAYVVGFRLMTKRPRWQRHVAYWAVLFLYGCGLTVLGIVLVR